MAEKYRNKRLLFRSGGRFRKPTLEDVGMTTCPNCGTLCPIKYDEDLDPRSKRADCNCQKPASPDATEKGEKHEG